MIYSDWHIHTECSYDATNSLEAVCRAAEDQKLRRIGITDHANFNDQKFLGDLRNSAAAVKAAQQKYPLLVLGVELTPIEKPEFDYIAKTGTRDGYQPPVQTGPYGIELAATKEELKALGVRYAIGAAHWRVDKPNAKQLPPDMDACIREWHRQQLWLACDERVTILGHPWYHGKRIWYHDFDLIPRSMKLELAAALKENGKYVECNSRFFRIPQSTELFRHQYAEFLRALFEQGIPVIYGSDSHHNYEDLRALPMKYLAEAGFKAGDFSELQDAVLW